MPQYNVELLDWQVTEPLCRQELQAFSMRRDPCMVTEQLGTTDPIAFSPFDGSGFTKQQIIKTDMMANPGATAYTVSHL